MTASNQIRSFLDESRPQRLVFDFSGVKFFSSQVLGMLLDIRSALQGQNGELVISAVNPQLYRVFQVTNLDTVFRFFPDATSAIEAEPPAGPE